MKYILCVFALIISAPSFATNTAAEDFISIGLPQLEKNLTKKVGSKTTLDKLSLKCIKTEGFGSTAFGVATCLVNFKDEVGGGVAAINILSDETGEISGKTLKIEILSSWD